VLVVAASLVCAWQPTAVAQQNATESEAAEASESSPDPSQPSATEQIQKLIRTQRPDEAAKLLDKALSENPDDAPLQRLHTGIAYAYLRARNNEAAVDQLHQYFKAFAPKVDSPEAAEQLASLVQQIRMFGSRTGQRDVVEQVVKQAIERCRDLEDDHPTAIQVPLARLIELRATSLANSGETEAARGLLEKQLQTLETINASDQASERTTMARLSLLATVANRFDDAEARTKLNEAFDRAMEAYPESDAIVQQYAMSEYTAISRMLGENPKQAVQRIDKAVELLKPRAKESRDLGTFLGRIESLKRRAEATLKQQQMIGKPAPPLDVDAWANTDSADVDDLKGKVVLYDFWAVWCGPCIATFPHLREWREEFGDQGFEIVGVTRYYGYKWDDENNRIMRAKEEVPPEEEQTAVARFLQSKEMQHPTIFTPERSDLQSQYAVTGIPHAVLVDRQGDVQMVKVGSGPANAQALHEKIKELLAE